MMPEKSEDAGSSLISAESRDIENSPKGDAGERGGHSEARRRLMKRMALGAFAAPVILASLEARAAPCVSGCPV